MIKQTVLGFKTERTEEYRSKFIGIQQVKSTDFKRMNF